MSGNADSTALHLYVRYLSANVLIIHAFLIKFDMCRNTFGKVHPISHPCLVHRKFLTDNDHENERARRAVQKQSRFYLVSDLHGTLER